MAKPVVYLLCGLPGSGKTVYAKRLVSAGCVRLSVDELIHARHGRYDVDYPAGDYPRHYGEEAAELDRRLVGLLEADQPAVLDYGLWEPPAASATRRWWKPTEEAGRSSTSRLSQMGCAAAWRSATWAQVRKRWPSPTTC